MKKPLNRKKVDNVTAPPSRAKTQPVPTSQRTSTRPLSSWPIQPSAQLAYFTKGTHSKEPGRHAQSLAIALQSSFSGLAKNEFERVAVKQMVTLRLPGFLFPADPHKKEFLFRYIYLPSLAMTIIAFHVKRGGDIPVWLATPATYVIAARRALMEMALLAHPELECQDQDINGNLGKLPGLRIDSWKDQNANIPFELWIERFEAFRNAAEDSYRYYMGERCPDIKNLALPQQQNAALWGAIANMSGLPSFCDGEIFHKLMKNGSEVANVFHKNALALPQGPSTFLRGKFKDIVSFAGKLKRRGDALSKYLFGRLSPELQRSLIGYSSGGPVPSLLQDKLVEETKTIVDGALIYEKKRFGHVRLRLETAKLLKTYRTEQGKRRLNLALIEDAYPGEISKDDELDTWLIEIWPLIKEHNWTKSELLRVAAIKDSSERGPLGDPRDLKKRCSKLGLGFSPRAKVKSRERNIPMALLAVGITSIAQCPDKWIAGLGVI